MVENVNKSLRDRLTKIESRLLMKRLYKVTEAAEIMSVTPAYLRLLIKKGTIPAVCLNPSAKSKHYLIDVESFIETLYK